MSTSIISGTNANGSVTTSSAFAYALDDVVQATITNPAGGLLTPCQVTLQLSPDGGVHYTSIDSERGTLEDGGHSLLVFEFVKYSRLGIWTHGRLIFSGNSAQSGLGVVISAGGDGSTWGIGGGVGTVTSVATGTGLTGGTITGAGTISVAAGSVNSLAGYSGTGVFSTVAIGAGLALSSGVLTSSGGGGSGTVTSVSVITANGVSGTVATNTTTPAITLSLGAITPTSIVASGNITGANLNGTNTGNQTITLTGDVTGSGTGSFAASISANAVVTASINNAAVTLPKMAPFAASSLMGNPTGSSAVPSAITLGANLSFSGTTLVATGGSGTPLTATPVKTTNYTALAGQYVPADATASAVQITLPTAPPDGTLVGVQCINTLGSSPGVVTGGSDVFNIAGGPTAINLDFTGETVLCLYRATGAIWYVVAQAMPVSQLDSRYGNASNLTTGTLAAARMVTTGLVIKQSISTITVATDGPTVTFDLSLSNWQQVTLGGNRILALSNPTTGQQVTLRLVQDGTGSRTVTWFSGITWIGTGTPPTLSTAAGAVDVFTFKITGSGAYDGFSTVSAGGGIGVTSITAGSGLTGGTIITTGTIALAPTGATITQANQTISAPADGATIPFDLSAASTFVPVALGGNRTLTLINSPTVTPWARPFTIVLTQDATGSRTVTWFGGIRWAGGSIPTLTTTAAKSDVFTFLQIASGVYLGFISGQNL